jgi:hypothetical protein
MTSRNSWRAEARCIIEAKPVAFFFPEANSPAANNEIRAYCANCPVRTNCVQAALEVEGASDYGWWGGMSRRDRMRLRATHPVDAACGTPSGYRAHINAGETPCDACVAARIVRVRNAPARVKPKPRTSSARCGTANGYAWHRRRREDACEACLAANATNVAKHRRRGGAA